MLMNYRVAQSFLIVFLTASALSADEASAVVQKAVEAVGGEAKLLSLFEMQESLNVSSDATKKGSIRVSVLEPPDYWWVGKAERAKEPAKMLVWAWTLRALLDPKSKIETLPEIVEADKPAIGLRVSETISPAMDLYFDKTSHLLVRIDWRADIHRFSDWKETDGVKYPAKAIGYRKSTEKPWYFSEILELKRLTELPDGLKR